MVSIASLARYARRKHEERKVENVVAAREFISCEQSDI
jgi:hypothetical protein